MISKSIRTLLLSCAALGFTHAAYSQQIIFAQEIGAVSHNGFTSASLFTGGDEGNPTVSAVQLSNFFGGVFLPSNIQGAPTDGSGVKAVFSLAGTNRASFAYQIATDEDLGSGYDHAFVYLDGNAYTLGNNSLANTPGLVTGRKNAAGLESAGPITLLTITNLAPGTHTVGAGVYDTDDQEATSGLVVERVPDLSNLLSVALEQREVLLGVVHTTVRDVGGRLFLLRSEGDADDEVTTLALATGYGKGGDAKDSKDSKVVKAAPARPTVEMYVAGDYGYGDRNDQGPADFVADTYVGTVGLEVHLNKHFTLGLAYSHVENRTEFPGGLAKLRVRGDAITPYVSYVNGHFYAEALYSYSKYDDQVSLGAGGGGTPSSENHNVSLNFGYNFTSGHLVTGPFAGVNYTTGNLGGFASPGFATPAVFGAQSYDSLITSIGWQASYKVPTHFGSVTPQLRLSWDRENLDDTDSVSVTLPGVNTQTLNAATGVLTNTGPLTGTGNTTHPNRDYMNLGAGVEVQVCSHASIILDYENHLLRGSFDEQFASVKVGIKF